MQVGIDAHKKSCTVCVVEEGTVTDSFSFPTTHEGVREFMEKIHEKATVIVEASTTGKVLSRMLLEKYEVHMVAPPERKRSIKTDQRDAERIVAEAGVEPDGHLTAVEEGAVRQPAAALRAVQHRVHARTRRAAAADRQRRRCQPQQLQEGGRRRVHRRRLLPRHRCWPMR